MAQCTTCYKDYISCGVETISVQGLLESNSAYIWKIENKGATYSGDATTDENGQFEIPVSELPAAFLNPYAGLFTLSVVSDDAYKCNSGIWNDSAYCDSYNCIEFEVRLGNEDKNTLGCPCPE